MRAPSCRSMEKHKSFRLAWHAWFSSFLCLTICSNLPSGEASPLDDYNYKSVVLPRQNYLFDKTTHIQQRNKSHCICIYKLSKMHWMGSDGELVQSQADWKTEPIPTNVFFCSIFAFVVFNETRQKSICLAEKMDWRENWKKELEVIKRNLWHVSLLNPTGRWEREGGRGEREREREQRKGWSKKWGRVTLIVKVIYLTVLPLTVGMAP